MRRSLDRIGWIVWIVSDGILLAGLYRYPFSWVCSEKLDLCALVGIMGEIGLLLSGWDGWTGWDGGGTGGVGGNDASRCRNGSATIDYLGAVGGGKQWLAPIVLMLQGIGVFVSEQQNNTNRLHTNWN